MLDTEKENPTRTRNSASGSYDQVFSGRFDNVFGEANKCVDAQDTFDLNE